MIQHQHLEQICPISQQESYKLINKLLDDMLNEESTLTDENDQMYNWNKMHISPNIEPHNVDESNVILIRHGLAQHNFLQIIKDFHERDIYNYTLLDPPLHYYGRKQCEFMRRHIELIDFDLVYVSPMLRAVQTAQIIFGNHPRKDKIMFRLSPWCAEKVSSQYSVYKWGRLTQLQENNGNPIKFDFSEIEGDDMEFWQFKQLKRMDQISKLNSIKQDQEQYMIDTFVKNGSPIYMEDHDEVDLRVAQFKQVLLEDAKKYKKIGIVSHSVLLKHLLLSIHQVVKIPLVNGSIQGIQL